ncbi:MAG TPA: peptidase [Pirellulales bacterium]|nr:peptidase [Pirellulales bacterium]
MSRPKRSIIRQAACFAVVAAAAIAGAGSLRADKVMHKDGRVIEGKIVRLITLAPKPGAAPANGAPQVQPIVLIDNDLTRIFVPKQQVLEAAPGDAGELIEHFKVRQHVAHLGGKVAQLGPMLRIDPFDGFGRRIIQMNFNQGPLPVVQGITEIWPTWTKVEALQVQGRNMIWDMRIATSSIPPDTLRSILYKQIDPKKVEHRLKLVRLFLQSERYQDALEELERIRTDFPEHKAQFEPTVRELKQAFARRALAEINVRAAAGQHMLAMRLLGAFPTDGVAGETLKAVQQELDEYRANFDQGVEIQKLFDAEVALLNDAGLKARIKPIRDEMFRELNLNSLDRMSAFWQFRAGAAMPPDEKLALAISGWLIGGNDSLRKLPVALSLVETRALVQQYLAEPIKLKRRQILAQFATQEAATPDLVAKLLRYMTPPLATEDPPQETPGFYELEAPGLSGDAPLKYYVQLPPEYDPHRLYPTIVTLHGAGTAPEHQIDWWAGARGPDGARQGQATRFGYIVIAPAWGAEGQIEYRYSAAEHGAVLNSLRDACRRFAIDTDRVFLSGHSMGGDATWDIGLAHPDLWAGIMPIVARSDKYIHLLWENAEFVPSYLVQGQLDGDKSVVNSKHLDRYLSHGFNFTLSEYQGRGHENFSDEIQRLFDWANRYHRDFFPRKFLCRSMRPWDNYFWWVECDDFPAKTMVDPDDWPPPKNYRAAQTEAVLNANNGINVTSGAKKVTIWLSPETIKFNQKIRISVNGRTAPLAGASVEADLPVLLEDARSRADRQHVFWAKVEMPSGKVNELND